MKKKILKRAGACSLATILAVSNFSGANLSSVHASEEKNVAEDAVFGDQEKEKGTVNGKVVETPERVNLTKEGDLDWVQLGTTDLNSINRKNTEIPGITNLKALESVTKVYDGTTVNFAYSDGMGEMFSPESLRKAAVFEGEGNGISFQVPASTEKQYVKVYTGAWAADIEATVKIDNEQVYSTTFGSEDTTAGTPAKYQTLLLDYQTESEDSTVIITLKVKTAYDKTWGNMNIGGIALGTLKEAEDDGSMIGGQKETAPASANLTDQGNLDWVHFNNKTFENYERKKVEDHAIKDVKMLGKTQEDPINLKTKTAFSYTDGTTNAEVSDNHASYVFLGKDSGLEFTLPGSTDMRYVNLYVGAWAADAKVEVLVNGKVQYTTVFGSESTVNDSTEYDVVRLCYKTNSNEDKVTVRTVVTKVYSEEWGNINIAAATFADRETTQSSEVIKTDDWVVDHSGGQIRSLQARIGGEMYDIPMRTDKYAGFTWRINGTNVAMTAGEKDDGSYIYTGTYKADGKDLKVTMQYSITDENQLAVKASIKNNQGKEVEIDQASIQLGFNTYLEKYPDYNDQLFPTLLRCEKTHAWGYLSTPSGRLMTIATEEPVASYTMDYQQGLHRIYSASLDVLQSGELPERHPQGMDKLAANEEKIWNIYLKPVEELNAAEEVKETISKNTKLPMFDADRYTLAQEEESKITILSQSALKNDELTVKDPDGKVSTLTVEDKGNGVYEAVFKAKDKKEGVYTVDAENEDGYIAQMTLSIRMDWSWYIKQARKAAVEAPQKGSTHGETFYGLYSGYVAKKYFPDAKWDEQIDNKVDEIYPLMYDTKTGIPTSEPERIQNHTTMMGIFIDSYESSGNVEHLKKAEGLADYLLTKQKADGGYYSWSQDYTSVIYPAKSLMEVVYVEERLKEDSTLSEEERADHKKRYETYMDSLTKAMDKLVKVDGNFDTEGQATFEDGANSCSVAQLSEFALMFPEGSEQRQKYTEAAEKYMKRHTSHQQSIIPDSRMNGATLRFWEAQYDVEMITTQESPNMMNSPHGWSAWNIYGLFNLYELTGNQEYLERGMNAMGTCAQVMGYDGTLRWAFVPDPQRNVKLFVKDEEKSEGDTIVGKHVDATIGEEYVPMISYWWRAKKDTYVKGHSQMGMGDSQGSGCDNDVHEIFKAMGEVALTKAYVAQKEDGTYEAYNATVKEKDGKLIVTPEEDVVSNVSVQVQKDTDVVVEFYDGDKEQNVKAGNPQWIITQENVEDVSKASKDSSLKALKVEGGKLDKEFETNVTEYAMKLPKEDVEITLTPTVNDEKASIYINDEKVENGKPHTISIKALQEEKIEIVVKSELQSTKTVYTINATTMGNVEILSTQGQKATAGSEHAASGKEGPASNLLDGNTSTIWHTRYNAATIPMKDRWVDIALKEPADVCGVRYLPRMDGQDNGKILEYEIHVSKDHGNAYEKVAEGVWDSKNEWKMATFDKVEGVTNVRIVPTKTSGEFGSGAEVRVLAEEEPTVVEEVSTEVLEYALSLAENVSTEGVIESVVERYNAALANAKDILKKAQDGDTALTQEMVDNAWKELINAMQYLSFKQGDKSDLAKVIALADEMNNDLSSYLEEGKENFVKALEAAKTVQADGDAMQEEVNTAWKELLTAMAGLQKIPDKTALGELLNKAEGLDEADYEAESFAAFRTVFADAKAVYEDGQATSAQVDAAAKELEEAIAKLTPAKDADDSTVANAGNTATGSDNKDTDTSKTSNVTKGTATKSAKTGDEANGTAAAAAMAAAVAALIAFRKKR